MQNVSMEDRSASVDAPLPAAPPEAQTARQAPDEASAPKHKKKKKNKHVPRMEHQTPGRVRMKFPSAKGNPELLAQFSQKFASVTGVERTEVNPTTGSVVVYYDAQRHDDFHDHLRRHCEEHHGAPPTPPATELDDISKKIEEEAEFLAEHSHAAKNVVHICKYLDHQVKRATGNTIDLKIGLAGGIVALSLLEMGAFAATPVWLTLGVFSLNHFVELQQHHALVEKMKMADAEASKSAPRS
jgi:cation transport ATPase